MDKCEDLYLFCVLCIESNLKTLTVWKIVWSMYGNNELQAD